MKPIKTEAFNLALKFINETNVNIFLTGKAGTGKTTFLKYLKENPTKNMAVAAPTGVAAINAGGITLHSMFHLPFGPFIPVHSGATFGFDKKDLLAKLRYNSDKINFLNALELLVIDEASMVAAYTVDAIDTILRSVRHKQIPFGGVQILFIGDLYQLQPVVKDDERIALKPYYPSNFFFDSHVLRDNIPVMVELKTIFRQRDESFIDILNGLRENNLTKEHLKKLNERLQPSFISKEGDGYITLTTHNNNANRLNELKLNRLKTPQFKFKAEIEGIFPEHILPAERELILKRDAQVMFIKNDTEGKRFFNGKIGIISEISEDEIIVTCDGVDISVGKHVWENLTYSVDEKTKDIKEKIVGTFTQYPLRLAWAITIHKSQGLTFDKVVIDAENAFANGQVYVALSRATSLEGLILTSPVNDRFLGPHADLKHWQETKQDEKSLPALFEKARQEYLKQMLFNVFSYEQYLFYFNRLNKEIAEFITEDNERLWFSEFSIKHQSLLATSIKFKQQLHKLWNSAPEYLSNEKLALRVNEGAKYFLEQLIEWQNIFVSHPLKIKNKKAARYIDKVFEEINEQIVISKTKTELCLSDFQLNKLATWKSALPKNIAKIKTTYVSSAEDEVEEKKSGLFELLAAYRDAIAKDEDLPAYMVFSNYAINNCCSMLPGDKTSLTAVGGFGKSKTDEYGEEVLKIIRQYCEEQNIELNYIKEKKKLKSVIKKSGTLSATVNETIALVKSGNKIKDICKIRNLAESTIEGHLALAVQNNLIQIETLMEIDEIEKIRSYFSGSSTDLSVARKNCDNKFSFGKLKLVQAWIISKKNEVNR